MSQDYFRSRHHFEAERVTHTLRIERGGASLLAPLIVRPIGRGLFDAISPYGYPGAELRGLAGIDRDSVDWSDLPLVSIFLRERLLGPHAFAGGTVRSRAQLVDPAKPHPMSRTTRMRVERLRREGVVTDVYQAVAAPQPARDCFVDLYRQAMVREGAAERYYFDDAWFGALFSAPDAVLLLTRDLDGAVLSGAILVESDGFVHCYLCATADAAVDRSPSKVTMADAIELAAARGLPMNLGGGLSPGDGLEKFKRAFSNAELPFLTHELVCDPAIYAHLSAGRGTDGFFPAYRAPIVARRFA